MEQEKFLITTKLEQDDHKKFMYITTFVKKKSSLVVTAVMSVLAGLAIGYIMDCVTFWAVTLIAIAYFAFITGVQAYKINKINKQRAKTERAAVFGTESILHFYEEHIVMEVPALKSTGELRYNQIYEIMETKDFFAVYTSANHASLIRKKDMEPEVVIKLRVFLKEKLQKQYKTLSV